MILKVGTYLSIFLNPVKIKWESLDFGANLEIGRQKFQFPTQPKSWKIVSLRNFAGQVILV